MSQKRKLQDFFRKFLVYGSALLVVSLLLFIIGYILFRGFQFITWEFLSTSSDALAGTIGILPALLNTIYIIILSLIIVLPLGIGAAIYLTEYSTNIYLKRIIEAMVETLAGIPSIIYGLVGMMFFVQVLGFGLSLYSGCFTMVIMILPTVIRTTQESLKTVPLAYREGALGLGSTKWHMIRTIVVPSALDGVVTGGILAIGRIVGESAALLFTAGLAESSVHAIWNAYDKSGGTLSVILYLYASERANFDVAFAIAAVLLIIVLFINCIAMFLQKKLKNNK